jgi:hypothetical protein
VIALSIKLLPSNETALKCDCFYVRGNRLWSPGSQTTDEKGRKFQKRKDFFREFSLVHYHLHTYRKKQDGGMLFAPYVNTFAGVFITKYAFAPIQISVALSCFHKSPHYGAVASHLDVLHKGVNKTYRTL